MTTLTRAAPALAGRARDMRPWVTAVLVLTVAMYVLGIGYIVAQGIFAQLSDIATAAAAVVMLRVAWYLHRVFGATGQPVSRVAVAVATCGLVLVALASAGLVVVDSLGGGNGAALLLVQHIGLALQGVWLLLLGWLGLSRPTTRRLTWSASLVAGTGYVVGTIANLAWGFEHPLFWAGFLVAAGGFLTWVVALRKDLAKAASGKVTR